MKGGLVGELSTQSEELRTRWAAHNVRIHQTGINHVHHSDRQAVARLRE